MYLCWVSFGQQLSFRPAVFSVSSPYPVEERENKRERCEKTPEPRSFASYHHKQNQLDLGNNNLLQIKLNIWARGNETTNIKRIPVLPPFPALPHSIFPLLWLCLFKGCSSLGVSSSPWNTFSFSSGLGVHTAVFHSYLHSSTAYVVLSALLKICFHRNATGLSCGLSCVLWRVC